MALQPGPHCGRRARHRARALCIPPHRRARLPHRVRRVSRRIRVVHAAAARDRLSTQRRPVARCRRRLRGRARRWIDRNAGRAADDLVRAARHAEGSAARSGAALHHGDAVVRIGAHGLAQQSFENGLAQSDVRSARSCGRGNARRLDVSPEIGDAVFRRIVLAVLLGAGLVLVV